MTKLTELKLPNCFADIQASCTDLLKVQVSTTKDLKLHSGKIVMPGKQLIKPCYPINFHFIGEGFNEKFDILIGKVNGIYRSSSDIQIIDFESNLVQTKSGNIYSYKEFLSDEPDALTLHFCATLNHFGMSKLAGTPPLFF